MSKPKPHHAPKTTDHLTPKNLADSLQVDVSTIYRYVRGGHIPHIRIGRAVRISRASAKAWIKSLAIHTPATPPENQAE